MDLSQGAGREACVVVNGKAGRGAARALGKLSESHLAQHGWRVALCVTERADDELGFAAAHGAAQLFVVVGGDGTLRKVAQGLGERGPRVALGLVPVGNANVVARELGLPLRDAAAAIELLTRGALLPFDVGEARPDARAPEPFLAMVGMGFDALTVCGLDRVRRTRLGERLYARGLSDVLYGVSATPAFFRLWPTRVRVTIGERTLAGHYPTVWICNTRTYAKGWSVTPAARPDDGELDHHLCRRTLAPLVLWQLLHAMRGAPAPRFLGEYGRGTRYVLEGTRSFHWQLDGDPRPPATRLEVTVRPAALRLVGPAR